MNGRDRSVEASFSPSTDLPKDPVDVRDDDLIRSTEVLLLLLFVTTTVLRRESGVPEVRLERPMESGVADDLLVLVVGVLLPLEVFPSDFLVVGAPVIDVFFFALIRRSFSTSASA